MDFSVANDPARLLRDLLAEGRFREALDLHRQAGVGAGRPEVQLGAATAATRLGELPLAEVLASEALERFRLRADADGRMRCLNLLGAVCFERGILDRAEQCFTDALELAQRTGNSKVAAHASNNLASVVHLKGRPAVALGLFRGALLSYQRLGDRRGAAQTHHNLALTFRQMGDLSEAERAAAEAVRHAELLGEPTLLALVLTGQAEVRLERKELGLAAHELDRAERLARQGDDEIGAAEVMRIRARLLLRRDEPVAAVGQAEAALTIAERHDSALLAAECAGVAALGLRALGRDLDAEQRIEQARSGLRELGARDLLERLEADWAAAGRRE